MEFPRHLMMGGTGSGQGPRDPVDSQSRARHAVIVAKLLNSEAVSVIKYPLRVHCKIIETQL